MKQLYFKQKVFKITDSYDVFDENDDVLYHVEEDLKFLGFTVNVTDPSGEYVFSIDKEIFNFLPKFNINFRDGSNIVMQSRFNLFKREIDIDSGGLDLTFVGDWFDLDFQIVKGGEIIAQINKKFLSFADTYTIGVYDEYYIDVVLAVTIGVDCLKDEQSRNSNSGS